LEIRFERKWKIPSDKFLNLDKALKNSNFCFNKHFEKRWVNSIYFDDFFNNSIYQNLDGIQKKYKVRIRWYGNKNVIKNPTIEIKKKDGFTVLKDKKQINSINTEISKQVLSNLTYELKKNFPILISFKPVSFTHYSRFYYISKDNKIRATIDKDISYKRINNFTVNYPIKKDNNIILELKYNTEHDYLVRKSFSNKNKLRISRNSKFINSILNI
tara:strand:- start:26 stop:670 length:645 start_codon:yes stop_codon:yes gene_type:complete